MSTRQAQQPEQPQAPLQTAKNNPFGISAVYRDVTCAISNVTKVVSATASGLNATATRFETQMWVSNAEFAVETCNKFNVRNDDGSSLTMVDAVATMQNLVSQLRGY